MARQKIERETKKITVRVFAEDLDYIKRAYQGKYTSVIRGLMAKHVRDIKEQEMKLQGGQLDA